VPVLRYVVGQWPVRVIGAIGIEIKERPFQGSRMGNVELERCEWSKVGRGDLHIPPKNS
jgi:hypothetical protein